MSSKHEPLEALARAYDREDASQRGEPDPWKDAEDDAEWVSERLACAQVAEAAYLAARSSPEAGKAVDERYGDKIYIASKTKHAERWRTIAATHPVSSSWIYEAGEGESSDLHDLWRRCLAEASGSKALVAYREPDEVFKGGWVEIGAALSNGVPVHAVGLEEFTIAHYRGITHHRTMKEAVTAALKEPSRSALASVPAPSGAEELCQDCPPVGYPTDTTRCLPCPRRAAPQAVPAEDVAELIDRLNEKHAAWQKLCDRWIAKGKADGMDIEDDFTALRKTTDGEAAAALARVTEERNAYIKACDDYERDLKHSEAEATSLRRKLEEVRKALEPFGNISITLEPDSNEIAALHSEIIAEVLSLTVGDLRRARTLSGASE